MSDWFKELGPGCGLSAGVARGLLDSGFVVIPGPVTGRRLDRLSRAYEVVLQKISIYTRY